MYIEGLPLTGSWEVTAKALRMSYLVRVCLCFPGGGGALSPARQSTLTARFMAASWGQTESAWSLERLQTKFGHTDGQPCLGNGLPGRAPDPEA